jgi:hypothetical protein
MVSELLHLFSAPYDRMIRHTLKVKNPGPENPALNSPQRGGVYLLTSTGMMEWWNNGILGINTEIILILTSNLEN